MTAPPPLTPASEGERIAVPGWLLEPHAEHYVVRVVGDAMGGICDGDWLVVRRCTAAAEGEMVVALLGDDATLRRFYLEGDTARLEASNPALDPIRLPLANLRIQGVAVGLIRRFDRREART